MSTKIIEIEKIGPQIAAESPFIAAMHHDDAYPKGNEDQGPAVSLEGRHIGQDFSGKDGFSMYHGSVVPGFPAHPHRGFETVTIVLEGVVDHFDSKGSQGRYGSGDVQWLTTGKGCQHTEMFPLVNEDSDNKLELFQLWLNLPAKSKFVEPDYKMLWKEDLPQVVIGDKSGEQVKVKLIAGSFEGEKSLGSTLDSWAYIEENHVGIMVIEMEPRSTFTLPPVSSTLNRNLYFYNGEGGIEVDGQSISSSNGIKLSGDDEILVTNKDYASYLLLLEGEPINEPVVFSGPFVMNTNQELQEAYDDYRKTEFGGWPWNVPDPVHERTQKRFAKHYDGRTERRE